MVRSTLSLIGYIGIEQLHLEANLQSIEQRCIFQLLKVLSNHSKNVSNLKSPKRPIRQTRSVKPLTLGCHIGLDPQCYHFVLEIQTCWYPKRLADPTQSITNQTLTLMDPMLTPHRPNVSQWNIVCVVSPRVGARFGHVHFMFFVSILFALATQQKSSFRWNIGYIHKESYCKIRRPEITRKFKKMNGYNLHDKSGERSNFPTVG